MPPPIPAMPPPTAPPTIPVLKAPSPPVTHGTTAPSMPPPIPAIATSDCTTNNTSLESAVTSCYKWNNSSFDATSDSGDATSDCTTNNTTALSRLVLLVVQSEVAIAGIGGGIEGAVVPCVTGGDGAFKTGIVGGAVGGGIAGIGGGIEGAVVPFVTGGDGAFKTGIVGWCSRRWHRRNRRCIEGVLSSSINDNSYFGDKIGVAQTSRDIFLNGFAPATKTLPLKQNVILGNTLNGGGVVGGGIAGIGGGIEGAVVPCVTGGES